MDAFDEAQGRLEAAQEEEAKQAFAGVKEKGDVAVVAKPKTSRVVRPSELAGKTYLESKEDVDAFLKALRRTLEEAIARDERIEIR